VGTRTLNAARIPESLRIPQIPIAEGSVTSICLVRRRGNDVRRKPRLREGWGGGSVVDVRFRRFPAYETGKTIGSGGSGADTRGSRAPSAREGLPSSFVGIKGVGEGEGGEPDF